MTALGLILVASLLAAEDTGAASPLGALPSGWVYLPGEGIDSFPGIYHDSISGACVSMDVAWPSVVSPLSAAGAEVGSANGVRFHRRYLKSKECRTGESLAVSFFPASDGPEPLLWHFSADMCQVGQRQRVDELLFSKARVGLPFPKPRNRKDLPTVPEVAGFKPGTPVADVVAKLGDPGSAWCDPGGGFTVGYAAVHGTSYREWDVRFDVRQRFRSAKRRHPGY